MYMATVLPECSVKFIERKKRQRSLEERLLIIAKIAPLLVLIILLGLPAEGIAKTEGHIPDTIVIKAALTKAVSGGMNLDEAVTQAIEKNPKQGKAALLKAPLK